MGVGSKAVEKAASKLKYPWLLALVALLFILDLTVLDPVPFVDEVILGLLTVLLARWRERSDPEEEPPMKNVTPSGE